MEVKAKISETETEIKEVSEAIKKLGVPLSTEDKDTLAYLRQKESNLSQEKKDLRQKENNLRQEKARLEALAAASTGSKASAGPGKTSARGASRYEQRVQLISRVHVREECELMFHAAAPPFYPICLLFKFELSVHLYPVRLPFFVHLFSLLHQAHPLFFFRLQHRVISPKSSRPCRAIASIATPSNGWPK